MVGISRFNDQPIYKQIAEDIKRKISSGQWVIGQKIPGELELAAEYNTSRGTVRKSMDLLVHNGLLHREPGRGTFIIEPILIGQTRFFGSFSNELRSMNYVPSSVLISRNIVKADGLLSKRLGLRIGDDLIEIKRLRKGNELKICVQTAWLPLRLFPGIENFDINNKSLYSFLQDNYDLALGEADEVFSVTKMDADEAKLLDVDEGTCAFRQDRVSYTQEGIAFEYVVGIFRGDRYKVQLRLNMMNNKA